MNELTNVTLLSLVIVAAGCGETDARGLGSSAQPVTAACAVGVWMTEETPCLCPSANLSMRNAECNETSCRQAAVYVYAADGSFRETVIQRGATTFTPVGGEPAVASGIWSIAGTHLVQAHNLPDGTPGRAWDTEATCGGDALTRVGALSYSRPPAGLAAALLGAAQSGKWAGRSYTP